MNRPWMKKSKWSKIENTGEIKEMKGRAVKEDTCSSWPWDERGSDGRDTYQNESVKLWRMLKD